MSDRLERLWYPRAPESWGRRVVLAPLSVASAAFHAGVRARGALYDAGWLPAHRVAGAKVISVGNLNVGGAGKTPAVIAVAERLHARGERVAVLSRGYGRTQREPVMFGAVFGAPAGAAAPVPSFAQAGDEPLLISRRCPWARLYVGADRVALARRAVEDGATALVLDDGFQHRRLARDVEIVVVDEAAAFGNGHLLPRGPLREPPSALARADLIWLRRGPDPSAPGRWPKPVVEAFHETGRVLLGGEARAVDARAALPGRPVVAFTGIARPGSFVRSLEAAGARVVTTFAFADHHVFTPAEVAHAGKAAKDAGALLITTEKDAVRLPAGTSLAVLSLEVRLGEGAGTLDALLARAPGART